MLVFFGFLLLSAHFSFAQDEYVERNAQENKTTPDDPLRNVSLGGNFSLLFGNTTFIDLSPQALYRFNSFFQAGPGITYMFLSDNIARYTAKIYGFRTIGRCYPIPWLFLHAEQEYLLGPWNATDNSWLASTYAGVGYRNLIGQQGGLDVLALFNLRPSDLSPFTNPTFRVGFMFYLKP